MGASAIPFTAIHEYFKIFGSGDFEEFLYYIRLMDDALMQLESAKQGGKQKGPTSGKPDTSKAHPSRR